MPGVEVGDREPNKSKNKTEKKKKKISILYTKCLCLTGYPNL